MKVTVYYLAPFNTITGTEQEEIELPTKSTPGDLITILGRKYGARFTGNIYAGDNKNFAGGYMVKFIRNGELITPEVKLHNGDQIKIIMAVGGG